MPGIVARVTRTLVISDLHLGSRLGRDTLRRPAVLAVLLKALVDVDRLVLLGDTVELLEARGSKAMATARPVLRALGTALGPDREVVLVPGNHDHALVRPWLRGRHARRQGIALDARVPARTERRLATIAGWLRPARVEVRYPGVWLSDRVYATHGHYLDRHLLPDLGWPTDRLFGAVPDHARVEDYETATGAGSIGLAGLSAVSLPGVIGEPLDFAVQAGHWYATLTAPIVARLTPGALAPLSAGALGFQFRRTGLPALGTVAERLDVDAEHVIFGHLHRAGPLPGDDLAEWSPRRHRLHNTGTWVYEPLLLAGAHPPHPYWPGAAVIVEDGEPRTVGLLDDLDPALLR